MVLVVSFEAGLSAIGVDYPLTLRDVNVGGPYRSNLGGK
jgi:hypothetical protein